MVRSLCFEFSSYNAKLEQEDDVLIPSTSTSMVTKELLNYIKQQIEEGVEKDVIKMKLMNNGWQDSDVEEAFKLLGEEAIEPPVPPVRPSPSVETSGEADNVETQPENQPTAGSMSYGDGTYPSFMTKPAKKGKKLIIILSIITLLLISAGAAGYVFYYLPQPKVVLQKMERKLRSVKTFEYSGTINTEATTARPDYSNVDWENWEEGPVEPEYKYETTRQNATFSGGIDINNKEKPRLSLLLDASSESSDGNLEYGIEMRIIDKIFYGQITQMPKLGLEEVSSIEKQWIKIDPKAIEEKTKEYGSDEEMGAILEEFTNQQQLSAGQLEKVNQLLIKYREKVLKGIVRQANEKIDGTAMYHYHFPVDKNEIKDFLREALKISFGDLKDEQIKDIIADYEIFIDDALAFTEFRDGELWLGKKDSLPHKITFGFTTRDKKDEKEKSIVDIVFSFKNYNQPVHIGIPQKATPVEQLLDQFFGEARSRAQDARIKTTLLMVRTFAETFRYNNSVDSYSDFTKDNQFIILADDITNQNSQLVSRINNNGLGYCAYAFLPGRGSYYCVDSQLFSKEYTVIPVTCAAGCITANSCSCE